MIAAATSTNRRLALAVVAMLCLFVAGAGGGSPAHGPPSGAAVQVAGSSDDSCHAEVTTKDFHVTQCPLASLHFHVSVSDCQDSRGIFVYQYTRVVPGRKETVENTAAWRTHAKEFVITERVPASCDDEIDGAEVERVTMCSCVKR